MWIRMSTFQGPPNQSDEEIDQNIKLVNEKALPSARQMDGFKGLITFGDRTSGKSITLTFWESEQAVRASEEAANQLRGQAAEDMKEEIAGVERHEVYVYEPPHP